MRRWRSWDARPILWFLLGAAAALVLGAIGDHADPARSAPEARVSHETPPR